MNCVNCSFLLRTVAYIHFKNYTDIAHMQFRLNLNMKQRAHIPSVEEHPHP